ncbi:MAG: Uma2 family endonuclease [Candidatus Bipolaricaulia bacterium]
MAKIEIPTKRLTYEEFLAWCDEDTWAEWVDGKVIVLTPASDKHQDLVRFLVQVLGIYVEMKDLGVVRPAPFQMKTGPELPGREPDILFIAKEHLDRLKETHLDGPADLVIEIVSSESRLRDRGEKFAEYEIGGVQEYWLIDPEERRADFYRLGEDGRYRIVDLEPEGIYRSQIIPDFWLRVEWLWQEPLPPVLDVLRELELI